MNLTTRLVGVASVLAVTACATRAPVFSPSHDPPPGAVDPGKRSGPITTTPPRRAVTAAGLATTQGGALDAATRSDEQHIVTIRGCLEGTLLTSTDLPEPLASGFAMTAGDRFRVVGDPELLDELRAFSGHEVDLIGVLGDDEPGRTHRGGRAGRIGEQTRVWISGGRRSPTQRNPFPEPSLSERGQAAEPTELEMRAVIPVNGSCPIL